MIGETHLARSLRPPRAVATVATFVAKPRPERYETAADLPRGIFPAPGRVPRRRNARWPPPTCGPPWRTSPRAFVPGARHPRGAAAHLFIRMRMCDSLSACAGPVARTLRGIRRYTFGGGDPMELPLQISFRHMDRSEYIEDVIREKAAKLDTRRAHHGCLSSWSPRATTPHQQSLRRSSRHHGSGRGDRGDTRASSARRTRTFASCATRSTHAPPLQDAPPAAQ
jgi:hypothetical protein